MAHQEKIENWTNTVGVLKNQTGVSEIYGKKT